MSITHTGVCVCDGECVVVVLPVFLLCVSKATQTEL